MDKSFWANKRVFITGHTGFKGSWLTTWLKLLGASVTGFSLPPQGHPNLFEAAKVAEGIHSIEGDILHYQDLATAIQNDQPEIIFHLAAQSLVHYSYHNPIETYQVNVIGTANLLEAVRHVPGVKGVLVITSDKCYENREWVWGYRETDAMGGFDPYSSSKGCAELVVSAYRRSFFNAAHYETHGVALASARAGNVIGGGDWASDRLIPDLIRSFVQNEEGKIRNPAACRPWQNILDILYGYILLMEQLYRKGPEFGEAWNFGPTEENVKPVSVIADKLLSLWQEDAKWSAVEVGKKLHEAICLRLDSNKSRMLLGWQSQMNIDHVLSHAVEWYKNFYRLADMSEFTQKQIIEYGMLRNL
ncbi:MAG: CDP-glucose 4,6-dehydratase [Gammaproteobacteria bacterium]|nr:CDP-glucose 4,6-dehydratase [Gammaproteobacteria bacterium]